MVKIVSIEGNIGSGKSTLIKQLNTDLNLKNVLFLPEPVDVWNEIKDTNGVTILEKYYINKSRYSFSFHHDKMSIERQHNAEKLPVPSKKPQ